MARQATKRPRTPTKHQRQPRQQRAQELRQPRQPRQPRLKQFSSCLVCLQKTAVKKLIAVFPTQPDSLRACKDCTKDLRQELLKDAYVAAMTPLPEAQECSANLEILLGVRLGAIAVHHREDGPMTLENKEGDTLKNERDFLVDEAVTTFTGATPTDIQRLASQPPVLGGYVGPQTDVTNLKEPAGMPLMNSTAPDYFAAGPKNDG